MNPLRSSLKLSGRILICFALVNLSVPAGAIETFGRPVSNALKERQHQESVRVAEMKKKAALNQSRPLTNKEQREIRGATGRNPYMAGQNKWDVVYKGVNMMTGNFSTSATDLSFEGGYGIPVNVTRSYSMNSMDEGPFGLGWSLSADVRSTAGGVLKSSGAPVRAVPTSFKERPAAQVGGMGGDPNALAATGKSMDPPAAVIATDAGGKEETIQKDVDGILTTPPWDKNVNNNTQYEIVTVGNNTYQLMTYNETVTPDGTKYVYQKKGSYPNGSKPWNNPTATAEPGNVMKVISATDRQGNTTTYTYDSTTTVTFVKANGTVTENPLTGISMPNGRKINLVWGNGTNAPVNRIYQVTDKPTPSSSGDRTIQYGYTGGNLTSVTSAAGFVTTYAYAGAQGSMSTITDARGLTTTITSEARYQFIGPYAIEMDVIATRRIDYPNGCYTLFGPISNSPAVAGDWIGVTEYDATGTITHTAHVSCTPVSYNTTAGPAEAFLIYGYFGADTPGSDIFPWRKTYIKSSQDLVIERSYVRPLPAIGSLAQSRGLIYNGSFPHCYSQAETAYNFMGNPLKKIVKEIKATSPNPSVSPERTASVEYAYWGADKYFQQKAVRDQSASSSSNWRISFTDYYDSAAAAGSKGQTKRVYDSANSTYTPASLVADDTPLTGWRYNVSPADLNKYVAEFTYDAKGRATVVKKIRSAPVGGTWTYVTTETTYGADSAPSWGQASMVKEDVGGVNRTTETLA